MKIFKSIPEWEGIYSASNYGEIRRDLQRTSARKGKILKQFIDKRGYHKIVLSDRQRSKCYSVHKIVAISFIGYVPEGYQINHIDGNKSNNKLSNIEIVTPKQNGEHASRIGLTMKGEKQHLAKLNKHDVKAIRYIYKIKGFTRERLAMMFNVHHSCITYAINRTTWKHIK